jgi:hypothetical protein
LRQKLTEALRDSRTSDDQFSDILDDIDELRGREHELWKREQDRLSKTLTPRQRAQFMVRWLRLQDTIRDMIDQRTGGGEGGDLLDTALMDPIYPAMASDLVRGGR